MCCLKKKKNEPLTEMDLSACLIESVYSLDEFNVGQVMDDLPGYR